MYKEILPDEETNRLRKKISTIHDWTQHWIAEISPTKMWCFEAIEVEELGQYLLQHWWQKNIYSYNYSWPRNYLQWIIFQNSIWLFKNFCWMFLTKINAKLIVNVVHHAWTMKKIFHSRSPKTFLNYISFTFLFYWKTDLHLVLERLL